MFADSKIFRIFAAIIHYSKKKQSKIYKIMKQNEENSQKAQELKKEDLENVNGGARKRPRKRFED